MEALRHALAADGLAGLGAGPVHGESRHELLDRVRHLLHRLSSAILLRRRMTATRLVLEDLDDRTLKDIGLYRPDVGTTVARLYEFDRAWSAPRAPLRRGG